MTIERQRKVPEPPPENPVTEWRVPISGWGPAVLTANTNVTFPTLTVPEGACLSLDELEDLRDALTEALEQSEVKIGDA